MEYKYQNSNNIVINQYISINEILQYQIIDKILQVKIVNKSNISVLQNGIKVFYVVLEDINHKRIQMKISNTLVDEYFRKINMNEKYEITNYKISNIKENSIYQMNSYYLICLNDTKIVPINNFSNIIQDKLCVQKNTKYINENERKYTSKSYQTTITNFFKYCKK